MTADPGSSCTIDVSSAATIPPSANSARACPSTPSHDVAGCGEEGHLRTASRAGARHPTHPRDLDGERHRIAPDVEDRAAGDRGVEEPSRARAGCEAESGLDPLGRAELSAREDRSDELSASGPNRVLNASTNGSPARVGRFEDAVDLVGRRTRRLLAQHGFARLERADREVGVRGVHGADVDGVDVVAREHFVVGAGCLGAVLGGEGRGPLCRGAADGVQHAVARTPQPGTKSRLIAPGPSTAHLVCRMSRCYRAGSPPSRCPVEPDVCEERAPAASAAIS